MFTGDFQIVIPLGGFLREVFFHDFGPKKSYHLFLPSYHGGTSRSDFAGIGRRSVVANFERGVWYMVGFCRMTILREYVNNRQRH